MNHKKKNKNTKVKKIRKLLLINVDNEMQKKIKKNNNVLINSMTPLELEKLYKLNNQPINTLISTYTNIMEKHIVEKIVDIPNNINYYQSDFHKKNKEKNQRFVRKYKQLYSAKNFIVNYDNLIINNNENLEKGREYELKYENENHEIIIEHILIPFTSKKKNVGEEKIKGTNEFSSLPMVGDGKKVCILKIKKSNNNNCTYKNNKTNKNDDNFLHFSSSECNSNKEEEENLAKHTKKKKILDINNKLIYYCYTNLKRKRPLIIKKSNTSTIYGLQIEEEFFKKNNNVVPIKKIDTRKSKINKVRRSKTIKDIQINSKKLNSSKKKRKDKDSNNNINIYGSKDNIIKKRRIKTLTYNNAESQGYPHFHYHAKHLSHQYTMKIDPKEFKFFANKKLNPKRNSKNNINLRNSNIKEVKDNACLEKNKIQNLMSKAETKTSSLDNSTHFLSLEKKKNYNIHHHPNNNTNHKKNKYKSNNNNKNHNEDKKSKNYKKINTINRNIKFMDYNKFKYDCQEEIMKIKEKHNLAKHKKSLHESIKVISNLKKMVGLDNEEMNAKENSKLQNNKRNHKLRFSMVDKLKSLKFKSRKNCMNYEDNYDEEERDTFYFNNNKYSNIIKGKPRGQSFKIKRSVK